MIDINNFSRLQVSTDSEQTRENVKMIKDILDMICNGLEQYHEK
jgi:hypothetical protein